MKKIIYLSLLIISCSLMGCGSATVYQKPAGHHSTCSCMDCVLASK